jgi:hypothetical protein
MREAAACNGPGLTDKIRPDRPSGSPNHGETAPAARVIALQAEPIGAEQTVSASGWLPGARPIIPRPDEISRLQSNGPVFLSTIGHHRVPKGMETNLAQPDMKKSFSFFNHDGVHLS